MKDPIKAAKPLRLDQQIASEAGAMASYAIEAGLMPDNQAMGAIARYEAYLPTADAGKPYPHLEELLHAHSALTSMVDPAKPRTILMLAQERQRGGALRVLGPIPLIRQMMGAALISLCLFILLGLSPHVNPDGGNILKSDGLPLLLNLLFFLSAAGLGASFHGLYKANAYLTAGTFDATYHTSYWIRFLLGLIAGLFLSVLISEKAFDANGHGSGILEEGVIRPLLAMLGGFSAELGYTILNRLVETVESLFRGSSKQAIENRVHQEKLQMEGLANQQRLGLVGELMHLQSQASKGDDPELLRRGLERILADLIPGHEKGEQEAPPR